MNAEQQLEYLSQGAATVVEPEELLAKLRLGRPLRVKYGADPSAPDLHLGHSVPLRRLRRFQELGHQIVFIIGDFTGRMGDPSGRSKMRPMLSEKEIQENARSYAEQVGKLLDVSQCEVLYNNDWFSQMTTADMLRLTSHYTVARMLERDDFAGRYQNGIPISILEMLYPLVQGYDSVAVRADVEIGGTDQLFNLLVGRDIQRAYGQEPQVTMTWPLLVGLDGKEKMSKSLGNYVGLTDSSQDMFGKLMSIPDELLPMYHELLLDWTPEQVQGLITDLERDRLHPRNVKADMAAAVTTQYYDAETAGQAREEFDRVFAEGQRPVEMPEIVITPAEAQAGVPIIQLIRRAEFTSSNSEARRLVRQRAVRLNEVTIDDEKAQVGVQDGDVLQVGKLRFGRLTLR